MNDLLSWGWGRVASGLLSTALALYSAPAAAAEASVLPPAGEVANHEAAVNEGAAGEATEVPAPPARWSLGVGSGLSLSLTEREVANFDSIYVDSPVLADLTLMPAVQVSPNVSVGALVGWSFEPGDRGLYTAQGSTIEQSTNLWRFGLEARYREGSSVGWYLAGAAGAAAVVDTLGDESLTQLGPLVSAALGLDWRVAAPFALGAEVRLTHAWFSEEGEQIVFANSSVLGNTAEYRYGSTTWLGFNLVGRFLL
jgi:hypothetical protein